MVAEKSAQAQDILDALARGGAPVKGGRGWGTMSDGTRVTVVACDGHLFTLAPPERYRPEWKNWNVAHVPIVPPNGEFRLETVNAQRVEMIANAARCAVEIINACDAGREGEGIFWDLADELGWRRGRTPITRLWLKSLETKAIVQAFHARRSAFDPRFQHLANASQIRRKADWIYGISSSRIATEYLVRPSGQRTQHVGRVQTPVLAWVHQRSMLAHRFVPKPFYQIFLKFRGESGQFPAVLKVEKADAFGSNDSCIASPERAKEIHDKLFGRPLLWMALDEIRRVKEAAPPPFNLVELERACARLFKWPARRTDQAAQRCYRTYKCITYPRTESELIPASLADDVAETYFWAWSKFFRREGASLVEQQLQFDPAVIVPDDEMGEDHHAILPNRVVPPESDADALVLWNLVLRRFLCALTAPAVVDACARVLICDTGKDQFRAVCDEGIIVEPGWLLMEDIVGNTRGFGLKLADRQSRKWIPVPADGLTMLMGATIHRGSTTPPDRHTYDSLLGLMKKHELGTAATRAEIVEGLIDNGYVEARGAELDTTPDGAHLVTGFSRTAPRAVGTDMAELWEGQLAKISEGRRGAWKEGKFIESVIEEVVAIKDLFSAAASGEGVPLCPFSGEPIEDRGTYWLMPGLPKVHFPKELCRRKMALAEWLSIATAPQSTGAGPFAGFVSKSGRTFGASIALHPKARNNRFIRFAGYA